MGGPRGSRGERKERGIRQPTAGGPKRAIPLRPCFLGSPAGARGGEAKSTQNQHHATRRGGNARRQPGGRKTRQGGQRDARPPPRGAGRHADPRSADFFRIPWRVWAPLAAHCGAGAQAGEERGHDGAANPRRRPAGPPTNPPPLARRAIVGGAKGGGPRTARLRAASPRRGGTALQRALITCHSGSRCGGCTERSGVQPQRNQGAHARAYCAGEGGRNAPLGVRGDTPASEQARAAPKGRARERERFSGRAVMVGPSFT